MKNLTPGEHLAANAKQAVDGALRDARDQVAGAAREPSLSTPDRPSPTDATPGGTRPDPQA